MHGLDTLGLDFGLLCPIAFEPLQIPTCTKNASFPREHDAADVRTAFSGIECFNGTCVDFRPKRVAKLRVTPGNDQCLSMTGA